MTEKRKNRDIIEVVNVFKAFGDNEILKGVSLKCEKGKITVIIGKSGTGKSVLIKNIIGILKPDSGEIYFKGKDMAKASERELIEMRKNVGYLFQDAALFDYMTVEDNIAFPLIEVVGMKDRKKIAEIVAEKLEWIDLPGIEKKFPSELSGGMRKRVGLARALAEHPEVLLFDEPTTGLDPILAENIDDLILKVNRELGITCIVISHDIPATFRIADKIAFLYDGQIQFFGVPDQALEFEHPVIKKFLDNSFNR